MTGEGQASFAESRPVKKREKTPLREDRNALKGLEFNVARLCGRVTQSHGQIADSQAPMRRRVVIDHERSPAGEPGQAVSKRGLHVELDRRSTNDWIDGHGRAHEIQQSE